MVTRLRAKVGLIRQGGFTYLALLFAVATMGAVLAVIGMVWSQAAQRDKERELLFVGNEFRQAIRLYYERTPGGVKRYPQKLEDLLIDSRQLAVQRYLRKIYRDPITGEKKWGTVPAPDGGIMGVFSLSEEVPLKSGNFRVADAMFEGAQHYADWMFSYLPPGSTPSAKPASPRGVSPFLPK